MLFIFTQSGPIQNIYTQLRLVVNVEYKKHTFCNPLPWRKLKFWIYYPQVILSNVGWEGGIQDFFMASFETHSNGGTAFRMSNKFGHLL